LFGQLEEEKEEKDLAGVTNKVFEAKQGKSKESYHLVSRFVSQGVLAKLVIPMKEVSWIYSCTFISYKPLLSLADHHAVNDIIFHCSF